MLELAAVLARFGLCSVFLCWMEWTALGMERLQSPLRNNQTMSQFSFLFVAILEQSLGNC